MGSEASRNEAVGRVVDLTGNGMETVPIVFNIGVILLLNVGVLLLSVVMLLVPAMLISGIRPIKVLRFE